MAVNTMYVFMFYCCYIYSDTNEANNENSIIYIKFVVRWSAGTTLFLVGRTPLQNDLDQKAKQNLSHTPVSLSLLILNMVHCSLCSPPYSALLVRLEVCRYVVVRVLGEGAVQGFLLLLFRIREMVVVEVRICVVRGKVGVCSKGCLHRSPFLMIIRRR